MKKSDLEKHLGRKLTKEEFKIEEQKFYRNFCRPETEEERKDARRERRRKPLGKYEVCEYILDWETLFYYDTYEEANNKARELFEETHMDIGILEDGILINEYKP